MLKIETSGIDEARRLFGSKIVEQSLTSTLNKVAAKASTAASREIRDKYTIKAKDLKKRGTSNRNGLSVVKAKRGRDYAMVMSTGHALPLINFRVTPRTPEADRRRKRGKGVKATVVKGKPYRIPHAFVAQMPSGHTGVFARKGKGRLPIRELFGPSIPQMFAERNTLDSIFRTVSRDSHAIFERELSFRVDKALRNRGSL